MEKRTKHYLQKYLVHRLFGEKNYFRFVFFKIYFQYKLGFEYEITNLLKRILKGGDVFFDVGANLGQYSIRLCGLAKSKVRIFAFEPLKINYAILKSYFGKNENFKVERYAVSDYSGSSDMKIPVIDGIRIGTQASLDNAVRKTEFEKHEKEIVEVISIDEYIERNRIDRLDYIKTDTEGGDARVILGSRKSISKYHPFIITEDILEGEALEFLTGLGYKQYTVSRNGRIYEGGLQTGKGSGKINDVVIYLHKNTVLRLKEYICN